jgi:uncharacterized protein involved in oxidation of intracellular sulfur
MKILIILNDPAYGTERSYNGLRLAEALQRAEAEIDVFLMADAVVCAKRGQKLPAGYSKLEVMIGSVLRRGARVLLCGTCMDARALADEELVAGAQRSTMEGPAALTLEADKVLVV